MEYHTLWEIDAHVPACTFVLSNQNYNSKYYGSFLKLTEFTGGLEVQNRKVLESIKLGSNDRNRFKIKQNMFKKIPGTPISYWIPKKIFNCYNKKLLEDYSEPKKGLSTGNNNLFIRYWFEVSINNLGLNLDSPNNKYKWYPINKGGPFKKWYGNNFFVVNWEKNGDSLKNFKGSVIRNERFYFNESLTWTMISSSKFGIRYSPKGYLFEGAGPSIFSSHGNLIYLLGFLCSNVAEYLLKIVNPTLNFNVENIKKLPIGDMDKKEYLNKLVLKNIDISKADWDNYEESWDFKKHPYIKNELKIKDANNQWQKYLEELKYQLFNNEKEINKFFIEKFGLNEIIQDIPEITLTTHDYEKDVKSFISYAIGCMFGRYNLDKEGLIYAGGEFDLNKYSKFIPDDDNIIPILDTEYFEDDIVGRFVEFVKIAFSEETLEENLDFIAGALSNSKKPSRQIIREYLLKNFFNDHKKTYKKCPIYWQFSSGKENGFNCLVYMHRYDSGLVSQIRTDYLHKTQKAIEHRITVLDTVINITTSSTEKNKSIKEKNKLQKQLKETQEYDEVLAHIANKKIEIDLDAGVKVNYAKFQNIEIKKEGKKTKKVNLLKKI